ncbi:hypothetical protein [Paraburkholderia xenovorans]
MNGDDRSGDEGPNLHKVDGLDSARVGLKVDDGPRDHGGNVYLRSGRRCCGGRRGDRFTAERLIYRGNADYDGKGNRAGRNQLTFGGHFELQITGDVNQKLHARVEIVPHPDQKIVVRRNKKYWLF